MAHATLIRTTPADGAVVDRAPRVVRVEFDDRVRIAPGTAAVSNDSGSSVLDGRPPPSAGAAHPPRGRAEGRCLQRPVEHRLRRRPPEEGVLAFSVGSGSPSPHSVLGASAPLAWNNLVLRTLYILGVLAAAGSRSSGC